MMSFAGKLNIYTCERCKNHIVTKDMDEGVTPFLIPSESYCPRKCKGSRTLMQSSMYRVHDQTMQHDYEWYKPDSVVGLSVNVAQHVEKGGLILRKREDG